ncbi:unnamed protein product [Protopolystoma xenopodis]|uniref:Uncharacterized protein n=1 Tax=Protopolystoma xenopodis TaxID=117903 RepID=A0A3S5B5Y2_9PLAT|nr:unnamed protein product [Protopolystoma xenopodis]
MAAKRRAMGRRVGRETEMTHQPRTRLSRKAVNNSLPESDPPSTWAATPAQLLNRLPSHHHPPPPATYRREISPFTRCICWPTYHFLDPRSRWPCTSLSLAPCVFVCVSVCVSVCHVGLSVLNRRTLICACEARVGHSMIA